MSSEVGAKPDREAYLRVCRELEAHPQDVTFIDDRPENIDGAAALGMKAVLFTDAAQVDALN